MYYIILSCTMSGEGVSMYLNIMYCIILYCIISGEGASLYCIMSGEGVSLYCIMSGEGVSLYCIMIGKGVSLYCIMSGERFCLSFNILPCNMMCRRVRRTINVFVKVQSIKVSTVMSWLMTANETKRTIITKFKTRGKSRSTRILSEGCDET